MNDEFLDDVVVRYDLNMAREDCVAQIKQIVETLGVVLDRIDALRADAADLVYQRLLRIAYDAKWIADVLNKEENEE